MIDKDAVLAAAEKYQEAVRVHKVAETYMVAMEERLVDATDTRERLWSEQMQAFTELRLAVEAA